jgi:hypothetical protein
MVIGIGVPRPVDVERAAAFAAIGIAQIGRDDAELALELVERVERMGRRKPRDGRVQPAAGDDQQRKAGTGLFKVNDCPTPVTYRRP